MKTLLPIELQKILAAQPSAPVIDVRTPVEFAEVHVPMARNVPLDELQLGALQLPKDQPIYLLCRSGQRATKAAEMFAKYPTRQRKWRVRGFALVGLRS